MDKENSNPKITPTGESKAKAAVLKKITEAKPKFTIEKLREHSIKLFGVESCTFDGAVYGKSGEYTVDEMEKIINEWRTEKPKEVK